LKRKIRKRMRLRWLKRRSHLLRMRLPQKRKKLRMSPQRSDRHAI